MEDGMIRVTLKVERDGAATIVTTAEARGDGSYAMEEAASEATKRAKFELTRRAGCTCDPKTPEDDRCTTTWIRCNGALASRTSQPPQDQLG
jgi:hypothetical protein